MTMMTDFLRSAAAGWLAELRDFDWDGLRDVETIGVWPAPVKCMLGLLLFLICMALGYWFHLRERQGQLEAVVAQEVDLRQDLTSRAALSSNLAIYQSQMQAMEETFGTLLARLPGETEVPGLLEDITFTGEDSGLSFATIQLRSEQEQDYYLELPISISVSGSYHGFAAFVSAVASLPRIVTLHDFSISRRDKKREDGKGKSLEMNITARTYRYKSP